MGDVREDPVLHVGSIKSDNMRWIVEEVTKVPIDLAVNATAACREVRGDDVDRSECGGGYHTGIPEAHTNKDLSFTIFVVGDGSRIVSVSDELGCGTIYRGNVCDGGC